MAVNLVTCFDLLNSWACLRSLRFSDLETFVSLALFAVFAKPDGFCESPFSVSLRVDVGPQSATVYFSQVAERGFLRNTPGGPNVCNQSEAHRL